MNVNQMVLSYQNEKTEVQCLLTKNDGQCFKNYSCLVTTNLLRNSRTFDNLVNVPVFL